LGIAGEVISRLRNLIVDENRGSYYLGSTVPDIRFFINASREETHFLSLNSEDNESGVSRMFEAHPELAENANLSAAKQSFIAGYLSHLVTDEAWIYQIYRPFFGESSPLGGDPMSNLMDRLLQFELDRRERLDSRNISAIRADLDDSVSDVGVSFIDAPSLSKWREFVFIIMTRQANWENFRNFAERHMLWMRQITSEELEAFFASFDAKLEQVLQTVSEEKLQEFREQSIADSVRVAREYLG